MLAGTSRIPCGHVSVPGTGTWPTGTERHYGRVLEPPDRSVWTWPRAWHLAVSRRGLAPGPPAPCGWDWARCWALSRVPPGPGSRTPAAARGLLQVFVRLHVEPHGEQRELEPRDHEQSDEDDRRDWDRVARDPVAHDDETEQHAGDCRDEPHHVEEHERVEVALHVLLPEPPEEAAHEQPRDARHDVAV